MKNKKIVTGVVFGIISLQIIGGIVIYFSLPDWSTRGTFGDMFGAINTLFSGLAFVGVIYAILLQQNELSLQRKELELTRKELARSASSQERTENISEENKKIALLSAKLSFLDKALDLVNSQLSQLMTTTAGSREEKERNSLLKRKNELLVHFEEITNALIKNNLYPLDYE